MSNSIESLPVYYSRPFDPDEALRINSALLSRWLVRFLQDECIRRRNMSNAIIGLSGGLDSAVTTMLCAEAFGPENTYVFLMPYKISSQESLTHAKLVADMTGAKSRIIDITKMVDGYLVEESNPSPVRIGNICARARTAILFDQSAKLIGLPIGTGNKTERMFGYFTWHADDAPPINPLGDLFKTQVLELAKELKVPQVIINKQPTADLIKGQTDEGDFGISYLKADRILAKMLEGYRPQKLTEMGFDKDEVEIVRKRVDSTHWKRRLPTVAVVSNSAIGEFYLRPVDY